MVGLGFSIAGFRVFRLEGLDGAKGLDTVGVISQKDGGAGP